MAKIIRNLNMDLGDMSADGGVRSFTVEGDPGAILSLEVKNAAGNYYNFTTNTFASAKSRLKQRAIEEGGRYVNRITFPTISSDDQYNIYLFAESAYDTEHAVSSEIRFADDSLDLNSSTGSNSSLVQKVIYQYTDATVKVYPWQLTASSDAYGWIDSYVADTFYVGVGKNSGKYSFTCTVTTGASEGIQILRQPIASDFFLELLVSLEPSGFKPVQGEDPWAEAASRSSGTTDGHTRGTSTLNQDGGADASGATKIIVDALPSNTQVGDRLTGHTVSGSQNCLNAGTSRDTSIVLITELNPDDDNAHEFSVDTGITIADGGTLYFNAPYYYRWQTKSSAGGYGVLGLETGSKEIDIKVESNPTTAISDGSNRPNTLGSYEDSVTYTTETLNDDGSITEQVNKTTTASYPAIDITGFKPTMTNGKITKQDGIITFVSPQKVDMAVAGLEGSTYFLARGFDWLKTIYDTEVKVSNLKVELTKPTTTTTSSVSNSTTIPVAERQGTIANVSTISGIGIAAGAANPTITSATASGAGSWTVGVAQTLESGATLTVEGTGRVATVTGDIEIINQGDANISFQLDVPSFILGA